MYFPRNRIVPFKSHRCPEALLRLPQVSSKNGLETRGELFITVGNIFVWFSLMVIFGAKRAQ